MTAARETRILNLGVHPACALTESRNMTSLGNPVRALGALSLALLLPLVVLFSTVGVASAAPTAAFRVSTTNPTVRQPVTFTFEGTCDVPPCTVDWRSFADSGGSSLGTFMGRGEVLTYAFPAADGYRVTAKITNSSRTHGSAVATQSLVVTGTVQDDDRRVGYDDWSGSTDVGATNGGFRSATSPNTFAAHRFSGTEATYVARTGPDLGIAEVTVGVTQESLDLYSPTRGTASLTVDGLTDGPHQIRVRPTGTKAAASTGTRITLDEFVVGTTHVDDRSAAVTYKTWSGLADAGASGGSVHNSATPGAGTQVAFWGPSVTWVSTTGPGHGRARVRIDGAVVGTIDLYSVTKATQVEHTFAGLAAGRHIIRVTVVGTHNLRSTGNRVGSDAFIVR